jgi:glycogen synthase
VGASPLRVLFLCRECGGELGAGGIGSYVQTIANALARRGHEVHVLSCVQGQAARDFHRAGVHVHVRGTRRLLPKVRKRVPATALRIEGSVSCYLEARRLGVAFDVVEAPDWMAEGFAFGLLRSPRLVAHLHTPLVLVGEHNPGSFRWSRDGRLASLVERFAVRRADVITSPSELLIRDLDRHGWLRNRDTRLVRYPIELEPWARVPPADSAPPRILAVGRLEARKLPEVVIRAAHALSSEVDGLEVVFVGRSLERNGRPYRDWLGEIADELGVRCEFVDEVPRGELPAWYGSARAVVVASRYDNFPFSALEAMAAGRPLVVTEATGTAEIVAGTDAGAVVPVDDPNRLAAALRPYLLDPHAARRAGAAARSVVERHCSPARVADDREACYRQAIRRRDEDRSSLSLARRRTARLPLW